MDERISSESDLAEVAVRYGFLDARQMQECRDESRRRGVSLIDVLLERDHVCATDVTTLRALAALRQDRGRPEDSETLSMKIVEEGFATGEQVEGWLDQWAQVAGPKPPFGQFLLHRGLLSSDQVLQLEGPQAGTEIAVGSRFGKYQIGALLGEGAAGYVFKAVDLDLQRTVAIKVLKQTESMLPQHLQRFLREAKIMANLRHPNIVPVYEVGVHDNRYYFTMDYVQGITLEEAFSKKTLSRGEIVEILEMVARALSFAHQCGVVHRDLKPSNILLDGRAPRIMDFGLAKIEREDSRLTQSGTVMGSPVYMPPEQVEGAGRVDARSDVYAIGVILYEGITGAVPYDAPQMPDLFTRILEGEAVPPRRLVPDLPADLEKVVLKAMERDPARRYAAAEELADDLKRVREGEPVKASGASKLTLMIRRLKKHRRMVASAVVAAVLALAAAGGYEYLRSLETTREAQVKIVLDDARAAVATFDLAVLSHRDDVHAAIPVLNRALDALSALPHPEADLLRGKILMRLARRDEAEAAFARRPDLADTDRGINLLLKSFPEIPPPEAAIARRVSKEGFVGTAVSAIFSGNASSAIKMVKELEPKLEGREQADLRKVLAILQACTRDPDGAAATAEAALAVRRVDPDLLWVSGHAHYYRRHDDEAARRADMRKAIDRLDAALAVGIGGDPVERLLVQAFGNWAGVALVADPFDEGFYRRAQSLFESVAPSRRDIEYCLDRGHVETWRFGSLTRAGRIDEDAFRSARRFYEKAGELGSKDPIIHVGIAMLYYFWLTYQSAHGDFDPSMREAAMKQVRAAIDEKPDYDKGWGIQIDLDSKWLVYLAGRGKNIDAEFTEARERAEAAPPSILAQSNYLVGLSSLYAAYYNYLINRAMHHDEIYDPGIEYCKRAIAANPRTAGAWINLGVLKSLRVTYLSAAGVLNEELYNEATAAFEEALKIEPGSVQALTGLASMYSKHYRELLKKGNDSDLIFQKAEELYQTVFKAAPTNLTSRYNVARLHVARIDYYVRQKRHVPADRMDAAQKHVEAILNQNPGLPMGKELLGEFLYLQCANEAREDQLDLQDLERGIRVNEEVAALGFILSGYLRLGALCELRNDPAKALEYYSRGIEKCIRVGDRAQLLAARGKLEHKAGMAPEALQDLEKAVSLDATLAGELKPLIDSLKR